jgi:hypothetical protein
MINDGVDAAPGREVVGHITTANTNTAAQACMYCVTIEFPYSCKNYFKFET